MRYMAEKMGRDSPGDAVEALRILVKNFGDHFDATRYQKRISTVVPL
jgi:hypothetical protein